MLCLDWKLSEAFAFMLNTVLVYYLHIYFNPPPQQTHFTNVGIEN